MTIEANVLDKAIETGVDKLAEQNIIMIVFILMLAFLCFIIWKIIMKLLDEVPRIVESIKELQNQSKDLVKAVEFNTNANETLYQGVQALIHQSERSEASLKEFKLEFEDEKKEALESRKRGQEAKKQIMDDMDKMPERIAKELRLVIDGKVYEPKAKRA